MFSFSIIGSTRLPVAYRLGSIDSRLFSIPPMIGTIRIVENGNEIQLEEVLSENWREEVTEQVLIPILITTATLCSPRRSVRNLVIGLVNRTLKDPCRNYDQVAASARFVNIVQKFLPTAHYDPPSFAECISKMPSSKRARIRNALKFLEEGHRDPDLSSRTCFLKVDETLADRPMKPRIIINLRPQAHLLSLPYARVLSAWMKEFFNGTPILLGHHTVSLYYGVGLDHDGLCSVGSVLSECEGGVFAGDDSLFNLYGTCFEFDFKQYDQHVGEQTTELVRYVSRALGVPNEIIDLWEHQSKGKCVYKQRKTGLRITFTAPRQQPSGIAITSCMNTLINICIFSDFVLRLPAQPLRIPEVCKEYETHCVELGFKVVGCGFPTILGATFLRGWWIPGTSGLVWLPLPSMVLKIGKISRESKYTIAQIAYCLATSPGDIPVDYPILGSFCEKMRTFGTYTTKQRKGGRIEIEKYIRVEVKQCTIDREVALDLVCSRYELTPNEIEVMEKLFREAPIPGLIHHPGFGHLAADYF